LSNVAAAVGQAVAAATVKLKTPLDVLDAVLHVAKASTDQ
jgi:hypothetical protein